MKKLIYLISFTTLFFSCNNEDALSEINSEALFMQIEKEYGLSLSETSRKLILNKYGSVENFESTLKNKVEQRSNIYKRPAKTGKSSEAFRYRVYCILPSGEETVVVQRFWSSTLLDDAEEQGKDIVTPYSCARVGASPGCACKQIDGVRFSQDEQSFLDDNQIDEGFLLPCVAYALSDSRILTHQEDNLF